MEIKLLRGGGVASANRLFRVDPKDIQDFALKVVKRANLEYGGEIRKVEFICTKKVNSVAYFTPLEYSLTINLEQVRTLRDLVFAIGHEVCHSIQTFTMGPKTMLKAYRLAAAIYGYDYHPMEREADEFGLAFENEVDYSNMVVNTNTSSIFINRKLWFSKTERE